MNAKLWILLPIAAVIVGCAAPDSGVAGAVAEGQASPPPGMTGSGEQMPKQPSDPAAFTPVDPNLGAGLNRPLLLAATQPKRVDLTAGRKIIRGASLTVRVNSIDEAEKQLNSLLKKSGGIVENASSNDLTTQDASMSFVLRIPVGEFDDAIQGIEKLGTRMAKTVSMQDVTAQMIDMDVRLKSLTTEQARLKALLSKDPNNWGYTSQLANIRAQMQSIEAQAKSQGNAAAYSTLQLTFRKGAVAGETKDPNWMAQAYGQASSSATDVLRVAATAFLYVVFFSPFYMPFVAAGWLYWRRQKRLEAKAAIATTVPAQGV